MTRAEIESLAEGMAPAVRLYFAQAITPLTARLDATDRRLDDQVRSAREPATPDLDGIMSAFDKAIERATAPLLDRSRVLELEVQTLKAELRSQTEAVSDLRSAPPERTVPAFDEKAFGEGLAEAGKLHVTQALMPLQERLEALEARSTEPAVGLTGAVIDRDGGLVLTLSNGSQQDVGQVVGRSVEPDAVAAMVRAEVARIPAPKDGFGFDDLSAQLAADERTLLLRFTRGDEVKEFPLVMPVVLDRGVFREGTTYEKGDACTFGGSLWIAQDRTSAKPDALASGWRLAVKRGRDGKDGEMRR